MKSLLSSINFSERVPGNYNIEKYRFSDIFDSTREFLYEHFEGAISLEDDIKYDGFVSLSRLGFAYFFKRMLAMVFGESLVHIKMVGTETSFDIDVHWKLNARFKKEYEDELVKIARNSGFEATLTNDNDEIRINLSLRIYEITYIPLRSITRRRIIVAFNEIFFL